MSGVDCRQITKRFVGHAVLNELNWAVSAGQSWGLVGPSGAGKTTLLRILAGLEAASSGEVVFAAANGVRLQRPAVGMVFQHLGLWPHLTAVQHIECVLKGGSRQAQKRVAEERLDEVCLPAACRDRRPEQLSGGELQRLAIARALAVEPQLLLLDEPLAQVDTPLRADLIALLRELIAGKKMTAIYVSHAWAEASQVAEYTAVLLDGQIVQADRVGTVYRAPVNSRVARLTGAVVEIPLRAIRDARITMTEGFDAGHQDDFVWAVRPQQLELMASDEVNRWEVVQCRLAGPAWHAVFESQGDRIQMPISQNLRAGDFVGLRMRDLEE